MTQKPLLYAWLLYCRYVDALFVAARSMDWLGSCWAFKSGESVCGGTVWLAAVLYVCSNKNSMCAGSQQVPIASLKSSNNTSLLFLVIPCIYSWYYRHSFIIYIHITEKSSTPIPITPHDLTPPPPLLGPRRKSPYSPHTSRSYTLDTSAPSASSTVPRSPDATSRCLPAPV